ncbi:MAG: hypothetical protein HQK65_01925 [Desulfamplus sp.]|nr:hypothetical protein [Desulfamplus sp.]
MEISEKVKQRITDLKMQVKRALTFRNSTEQDNLDEIIRAIVSIHRVSADFKEDYLVNSFDINEIELMQKEIASFDIEVANLEKTRNQLSECENEISRMKAPLLFGKKTFMNEKSAKEEKVIRYKSNISNIEEKVNNKISSIDVKRKSIENWEAEKQTIQNQYKFDHDAFEENRKIFVNKLREQLLNKDIDSIDNKTERPDIDEVMSTLVDFCNNAGLEFESSENSSGEIIIEIRGRVSEDNRDLIYIIHTSDYHDLSLIHFWTYTSILENEIKDPNKLLQYNNVPFWSAKLNPIESGNPIKILRINHEMLINFQPPIIDEIVKLILNSFKSCTTLNNYLKGICPVEEFDGLFKTEIEDIYTHPSYRVLIDIVENSELLLKMETVDKIELIEFDRQTLLIKAFGTESVSEIYLQLCSTDQFKDITGQLKFLRFLSIIKQEDTVNYSHSNIMELFKQQIHYQCLAINEIGGVKYFTNKYDQIIHDPVNKVEIEYILSHLIGVSNAFPQLFSIFRA